jgi:hypothetical protein
LTCMSLLSLVVRRRNSLPSCNRAITISRCVWCAVSGWCHRRTFTVSVSLVLSSPLCMCDLPTGACAGHRQGPYVSAAAGGGIPWGQDRSMSPLHPNPPPPHTPCRYLEGVRAVQHFLWHALHACIACASAGACVWRSECLGLYHRQSKGLLQGHGDACVGVCRGAPGAGVMGRCPHVIAAAPLIHLRGLFLLPPHAAFCECPVT